MDQQRHKLFHKVGVCQDDKKERFYRQKKKNGNIFSTFKPRLTQNLRRKFKTVRFLLLLCQTVC